MQSKRSFFNFTLFRKNLSRSWPLWGSVTAMGALIPLYLMLAMVNVDAGIEKTEFTAFLYQAAVYFLPSFTFMYAIPVAMVVWSYLHKPRAVGMMHSLAIDRTGLFITNALSGFAMLLIPYVVVGFLLCLLAAGYGALEAGGLMVTIAAVILENILFFGMATLCAMVTGRVVMTVAFYLILNFAVPVLDALIGLLAAEFIFGFNGSSGELASWFAPLNSLLSHVSMKYEENIPSIEGFSNIVVYALAGLAMLALGWYLYRFRKSESAGDVVAFTWLRPVFRFGVAIVSGMTLGRVLYELFWNSLFYNDGTGILPLAAWSTVGAVVGYYAASMMLEKTLRVFKGSLKGVGLVCAVTVALCLVVALDVFGIEKYVPDEDRIDSVSISGYIDIYCDGEEMPGLLSEIRAMHEAVIADEEHVRTAGDKGYYADGRNGYRWRPLYITYTLKNGSTVERYYFLPLSQERMAKADTYDGKLLGITRNPEALIASVTMPEDAEIMCAYVESYGIETMDDVFYDFDEEAWEVIYLALQQDAREGNFYLEKSGWLIDETETEEFSGEVLLVVDYQVPASQTDHYYERYRTIQVNLRPTMVHTLKALVSSDVLIEDVVNEWMAQTSVNS